MQTFWQQHWYKAVMATVSLLLIGVVAYVYLGGQKEELPIVKAAANFELTDIDGNTVSIENTAGKTRLLYFFFANCPDVCPVTTHMLSRVQMKLQDQGLFGSDTMILQATIDPDRDTPETLRKYADSYGADLNGWKFLRGTEQQVKDIAQSYGIGIIKDEQGNFGHINAVFLIDKDNQVRRIYQSNDLNEKLIASDMIRLAK